MSDVTPMTCLRSNQEEIMYLEEVEEIRKLMPSREHLIEMSRLSPPPQEWFDEGKRSSAMPVVCLHCGSPAIAIFRFPHGCYCDPAEIQPLCLHHAFKSGPPSGGSMELVEDLTADGSFTRYWSELHA